MSSGSRTRVFAALGLLVAIACVAATARLASDVSRAPERCGAPFVAVGARCCAPGQTVDERGRCAGIPAGCGSSRTLEAGACVLAVTRIRVPGGTLSIGPSDWEAQGVVTARKLEVQSFELESTEVSVARWSACVEAHACRPSRAAIERDDPGRAAVLTADEASELCRTIGGRLPSADEWVFAAMGSPPRRYPWGDTGAVCLRAAFGLETGPCANGARGPDTIGAHPLGQSPWGFHDLAGNLAEWVRESDGTVSLRGGSYRTTSAAELRTWFARRVERDEAPPDAGARCAFDVPLGNSAEGH